MKWPEAEAQCSDDSSCEKRCELAARDFGNPQTDTPQLTDAVCATNRSCECHVANGGASYALTSGAGCQLKGRLDNCLFDGSEHAACTLTSCSGECSTLQSRLTSDDARTITVKVLTSRCWQSTSYRGCDCVFDIEGVCVAGSEPEYAQKYDCGLGAEQILADHGRATHSCSCSTAGSAVALLALVLLRRRRR